MKTFISFSGGYDSTALVILYGNKWQPIFADTGAEFPQVYEHLNKVEKILGIEVIRVRNEEHKGLISYIQKSKFFPSWKQRYCTRMFKIEAIENYLNKQGEFKLAIGMLADEEHLRGGNHEKYAIYPFFRDWLNYTKKDTIRICNEHDLDPQYPWYMSRGGCYNCFFKTKDEIVGLYREEPELFQQLINLEEEAQDKRNYFMFGNLGMKLSRLKNILDSGEQLKMKFDDILIHHPTLLLLSIAKAVRYSAFNRS